MQLFGGRGSGTVSVDLAGAVPIDHVRYQLARFRLKGVLQELVAVRAIHQSLSCAVGIGNR
jgi:hypothetical protein